MKKIAILACIACILSGAVFAQETTTPTKADRHSMTKEEFMQIKKAREAAFEQKLGLTEEQKAQAREIRKQGHEKMRPLMEQIFQKKQEAKMIKLSRMAVQDQEEKLSVIDEEIKSLEKQLHAYRKDNMKQFESILTRKQKKILNQMKKEGRQNFQKEHKPMTYSHKS